MGAGPHLGCAVAGRARVGAVQRRGALCAGNGLGETKIGQLEGGAARGEEEVGGLDVTVQDDGVPVVQEVQRRQEVKAPPVDSGFPQIESWL